MPILNSLGSCHSTIGFASFVLISHPAHPPPFPHFTPARRKRGMAKPTTDTFQDIHVLSMYLHTSTHTFCVSKRNSQVQDKRGQSWRAKAPSVPIPHCSESPETEEMMNNQNVMVPTPRDYNQHTIENERMRTAAHMKWASQEYPGFVWSSKRLIDQHPHIRTYASLSPGTESGASDVCEP